MLTLKLALRGLWRHKLRTIVTLIAVGFGYLLLLAFMSMHEGGHGEMIEMGIRQGHAGHVVVQAKGYQQSRAVELLVPEPEAVRQAISRQAPRARVVLRVFGGGLARTSEDAVGIMFMGIEPAKERPSSEIAKHMVEGVYLDADEATIAKAERKAGELWCARPQPKDAPQVRRVVIGAQLADTLKLELCDKLVLDAQGLGDREAAQLRVVGLYKTASSDLDGFFAQVPLADAQELLHIDGAVHQLAVFIESAEGSQAVADKLRAAARQPGNPLARFAELEVLPWDKALPELAEFIWLDASSGWVFMILIYLIIAIGVLNTVLMSVMERTRELGVMRALGLKPFGVMRLVLGEGFVMGALGVVIGGIFAAPVLYWMQTSGIDLTMWADEAVEMGGLTISVMYGKTSVSQIAAGAIAVFAMTILSAVYPAIRAARLEILRAIYHV